MESAIVQFPLNATRCLTAIRTFFFTFSLVIMSLSLAQANDNALKIQVTSPFVDVYTGPGRGFPAFYVAEKGEWIEVLERKTDWFKIRLSNGKEGWVFRDQLSNTIDETGQEVVIEDPDIEDYHKRRWETGLLVGDFSGATSLSLFGNYHFTANIAVEGMFSQMVGDFSSSYKGHFNLIHQAFPDWRVSPYFMLGAGMIHTSPKATLIETDNREDELLFAGGGLKIYITRYFVFRTEYKSFVILTDRNQNEEVEEWTLGFSIFFN